MTNSEVPKNTNELTINDALLKIKDYEARVRVMGRNDTEFSDFASIISRLESGELTPLRAVAEAEAILETKQDYN